MRRANLVTLAATFAVFAACATGIRPSFEPFPQATVDTISTDPAGAIQEISARLIEEAIQVQWSSPEEGYIESQWYNVITRESGVTDRANPERVILLRFWADPLEDGRSVVTAEAVMKRTADPSVMPRDSEMLVPPAHVGQRIVDRVLQSLRERFGN